MGRCQWATLLPFSANDAELDAFATDSNGYQQAAECTWSGFSNSVTSTVSPMILTVNVALGGNSGGPGGQNYNCRLGNAYLFGPTGGTLWSTGCKGSATVTVTVPAHSDLTTYSVTGAVEIANASYPSSWFAALAITGIFIQ